jgi:hypothetical protein
LIETRERLLAATQREKEVAAIDVRRREVRRKIQDSIDRRERFFRPPLLVGHDRKAQHGFDVVRDGREHLQIKRAGFMEGPGLVLCRG